MIKRFLYVVVVVSAILVPTEPKELGTMLPVETVMMRLLDSQVQIVTDTGDYGVGNSVKEAVDDLEDKAAGTVYLDTAKYLISSRDLEWSIKDMAAYLKGNTRICITEVDLDIQKATAYLRTHKPEVTLQDWGINEAENMVVEEGRYTLK